MLSHELECDAEILAPALPDTLIGEEIALLKDAGRAGVKLATAESCTGGLLSSLLTDVEGTSHVFDRGFVTYSKRSKCDLLGVPAGMIRWHGDVSEEVARAMAWGALRRSDATVAFAIAGFTGKAGSTQEAGLVHLACVTEGGYRDHQLYRFGDIGRGATRVAALQAAIHHLRVAVRHPDLPSKSHPARTV